MFRPSFSAFQNSLKMAAELGDCIATVRVEHGHIVRPSRIEIFVCDGIPFHSAIMFEHLDEIKEFIQVIHYCDNSVITQKIFLGISTLPSSTVYLSLLSTVITRSETR